METIIDTYYKQNEDILKFLEEQNEISYKNDADDKLKKVFVLYIASYFEAEVCSIIISHVNQRVSGSYIPHFVQNKAIQRQYHTFFSWDRRNANTFFSLFGDDFKKRAEKEIKICKLEGSVGAFLEIGYLRNCMVHQNAGTFPINKTSEEIYTLYKDAQKFIEFLRRIFTVGFSKKYQLCKKPFG